MRAVVFTGAGGNEVVDVLERPDPRPGPSEVLVAVEIAGMNPADLEQREGRYPPPPGAAADVPGLEVAGEVVGLGDAVTSWRAGDRVFGLVAGGGLASRVAVHEDCVTRVPDRLDPAHAAAVPEAWITAHDALRQGDLGPGETLLVRGATGAVGSAAVRIAVLGGARVLAPVRSDDAAAAMRELGAEALADDPDAVRGAVGEAGVNVAVELVGGEHVAADLAVLALRGRIVVVSVAAGSEVRVDLRQLMVRRATLRGTVLRARSIEEKAAVVAAFARDVVPLLADGRARPAIDRIVPVDEIHAAFDRLGSRGKAGKVLVRFA